MKVEVSTLNLQRLVTKEEIKLMRRLYQELRSVHKVARLLGRSPTTVNHYLKSDERMSR